jgi:hypothetical protein
MMPQRLVVPLFQRPYVWNRESQWEPLWNDVTRVADRQLSHSALRRQPHFLGAVVLQQVPNPIGLMQQRTIIDGQQRLTTLQLMLDALHGALLSAHATQPALRLEQLVTNAPAFCTNDEDRFKVWPTNRDRAAFNDVMGAAPPVRYDALPHHGDRLVEAHRYFGEQAHEWLNADGPRGVDARAAAIDTTVRDLLQMVVIDLAVDENAQEIFETLNARGAQLTAADLIKNFIFQRLLEKGANVEDAYQRHWKEFETAFWETEVTAGRFRHQRSSIFLNHWLTARTGEEVVAREVFSRFKSYADFDAGISMPVLLEQVHRASAVYRDFQIASEARSGAIDRLGLFGYRTGVQESEVIKPLILQLLDPEKHAVPKPQLDKSLDAVESWMVRRMLVRVTTKAHNKIVSDMVRALQAAPRDQAGDVVETFLRALKGESQYWPDDEDVRSSLRDQPIYKRLSRGRLRMVLEAIEDHKRGWRPGKDGLGGERVARGKYAIEHILPRRWAAYWPAPDGPQGELERERLLHTLGNLTLLTGPLNSKVSNGPWTGASGKWEALEAHDVLLLNNELRKKAPDAWTHDLIRRRTDELIDSIIQIWPVPAGHRSTGIAKPRSPGRITLADLLAAGVLTPGMTLYPARAKFADRTATLLSDGQIDVDGTVYARPKEAASALAGRSVNGWFFFRVDKVAGQSLRDVLRSYLAQFPDMEEEDDEDGEDED